MVILEMCSRSCFIGKTLTQAASLTEAIEKCFCFCPFNKHFKYESKHDCKEEWQISLS